MRYLTSFLVLFAMLQLTVAAQTEVTFEESRTAYVKATHCCIMLLLSGSGDTMTQAAVNNAELYRKITGLIRTECPTASFSIHPVNTGTQTFGSYSKRSDTWMPDVTTLLVAELPANPALAGKLLDEAIKAGAAPFAGTWSANRKSALFFGVQEAPGTEEQLYAAIVADAKQELQLIQPGDYRLQRTYRIPPAAPEGLLTDRNIRLRNPFPYAGLNPDRIPVKVELAMRFTLL